MSAWRHHRVSTQAAGPCHDGCMCGRYASTKNPATLAVEFDAIDGTADTGAPGADYNVAPTKPVLTVVDRHPRDAEGTPDPGRTVRSVRVMRWGLVPHWAKDPGIGSRLINARAESAASKPSFRDALARRRCLVPADGWYEWQAATQPGTRKQPYFITSTDDSSLALAGLWAVWRDPDPAAPPLVTCAVLTTDAVGPLAGIHDRMPLVLPRDRWADWLDPAREDVAELAAPTPPELVEGLELRPVSPAVNSVKHNGVELTARAESVAAPADQPALF
jgi:putative SOS response-associated peptidase YedK